LGPGLPSDINSQIYMDVDCSAITYDVTPSAAVLAAVEKAQYDLTATASNGTEEVVDR
jgi:hypothetical protein